MTRICNIIKIFVFVMIIGCVSILIYKTNFNNHLNNEISLGDTYNCKAGQYYFRFLFMHGCLKCPKGSYCPGDDDKHDCPKFLTTADTGSTSSKECDHCKVEGKWYNKKSCVDCPIGYYCANGWKTECPTGKTTKKTGAKKSSECVDIVCKTGEYLNGNNCDICPKNNYCDGKKITYCGDYRETAGKGKSKSSDCICKAGYYDYKNICTLCPVGSYCRNGKQYSCGTGKTTKSDGSTSINDCIDKPAQTCKTGEYLYGKSCLTCLEGHYCSENKMYECEKGSYQDLRGRAYCSACKAGTYQDEKGSKTCKTCPTGYTSLTRSTSIKSCYQTINAGYSFVSGKKAKCDKGTYAIKRNVYYGNDSKCIQCGKGYYQDKTGQSSCKKCPDGYTSEKGATSKNSCYRIIAAGYKLVSNKLTKCSKGTYSIQRKVNYGKDSKCTACLKGYYQDQEGKSSCVMCKSGYTTKSTGAKSASACNVKVKCGDGKYVDGIKCSPCPVGYYCKGGIKTICGVNTYQDKTEQKSCKSCPKGYTSNAGSTSINQCHQTVYAGYGWKDGVGYVCGKGTYSTKREVYYNQNSECTKCPKGYTTKKDTSTKKSDCIKK